MPGAKNASAGAHQPARIFVVGVVPELRRIGAMRELQHLHDVSQAPQPARMPLLRRDPAGAEAMSQVPVAICLFLWRRLGASGGAAAQGISWNADRAARSRYSANEAAVSGDPGRFCR